MSVLEILQERIGKVGIKEVARRALLSASTVSRIRSGKISPSLEVTERISKILGLELELHSKIQNASAPRLELAIQTINNLKKELKILGVKHATIFGSVARKDDGPSSDIDIYLDFGDERPKAQKLLKAEGIIIATFGEGKVDIVSQLEGAKNSGLKQRIEKDGVCVF
jgi:predicted nucleotidyltransferase